jgi:cerevisin
MKYILTSLFALIPTVLGSYILTPKIQSNTFMFFDLESFNEEHNIEHFVTIGDLTLYKTHGDNFETYKNTLSAFYEIEQEQEYKINDFEKQFVLVNNAELPWHLGRITSRDLPLEESFSYSKCHNNKDIEIHTYVVDTGIDVSHPEFEGRAEWLANFADSENTDCNSHGTHCAGLVGSKTFGVCKDAKLFAVKVLDCQGSGSTSSVISGINFAFKRHQEQNAKSGGKTRSVISMSLGGGYSYALNRAVQATLKDPNFFFAAAAGNENSDACKTSPAGVKEIFTVMASGKDDARAYFSNYGRCADLYSPGVNIESTVPDDNTAVYSGTSMACPVFVGVLNHYIDQYPDLNMKQMKKKVLEETSKDKLSGNPKNTNNYLVYLHRDV